jgi:hypothetical protein
MHFIEKVEGHPDHTVTVHWVGGGSDRVDFRPMLDGPALEPLRDPDFFASMLTVVHDGYAIGWPGDLHFSADSLWYRTHPEDSKRDYPDVAAE